MSDTMGFKLELCHLLTYIEICRSHFYLWIEHNIHFAKFFITFWPIEHIATSFFLYIHFLSKSIKIILYERNFFFEVFEEIVVVENIAQLIKIQSLRICFLLSADHLVLFCHQYEKLKK